MNSTAEKSLDMMATRQIANHQHLNYELPQQKFQLNRIIFEGDISILRRAFWDPVYRQGSSWNQAQDSG